MSEAVRAKKKVIIEEKIDQFCQNSAELLKNIHERCSDTTGGKASGKGKRKRSKKE
ncbi:MAG: hypothetical protein ABFR82_14080 [Nitrospirota bacterium]